MKKSAFFILLILFSFVQTLSADQLDSLRAVKERLITNREAQQKLQHRLFSTDTSLVKQYEQLLNDILKNKTTEPITYKNDTLWTMYEGLGPLSAKERADLISKRIETLIALPIFDSEKLVLIQESSDIRLIYDHDLTITIFTQGDALYRPITQWELAEQFKQKISDYIVKQRESDSFSRIALNILLIIFIIIVFVMIIIGINRGFKWISIKAEHWQSVVLTQLRIGNFQLFDHQRAGIFTGWILQISRWVLILLSFYLLLPIVFSLFPFTEGLAKLLFGYIWSPFKAIILSFFNFIPNLFSIIVIFFVTRLVVRFLKFLADEIEKGELVIPGFYNEWALPTYNIVRFLLYAFMIVVIFPYLPGSDSRVFQGVSVFLGILFSLGSSSAVSNMVAGLVITYMRPFNIGDIITLENLTGKVIEKNLLVTRLQTATGEEITIPNGSILSGKSINYSVAAKRKELMLHTKLSIGYHIPWQRVYALLIEAANRTKHVLKTPEPFVLQDKLGNYYAVYELHAFTEQAALMPDIYSELHQHIQTVFNENGVEILTPDYKANRDGSASTIPQKK